MIELQVVEDFFKLGFSNIWRENWGRWVLEKKFMRWWETRGTAARPDLVTWQWSWRAWDRERVRVRERRRLQIALYCSSKLSLVRVFIG